MNGPIRTPPPWIVAHRGASGVLPENTLPAFERALALGVDEIEFDLWATADREVAACHDPTLERTTGCPKRLAEATWAEVQSLDAGRWFGEIWRNVRIPRVEDIFVLAARRAGMNIHVKDPGPEGVVITRVADLARRFGVTDQVYITGKRDVMECAAALAPDLVRCCLEGQARGSDQIEWALRLGCRRIQFSVHCCTDADLRRARDLGLTVNYYFCDEPVEAQRLFGAGVQALLTNHPERISRPA